MAKKKCAKCRRIVVGEHCPICKSSKLEENWKGRVIILDPAKSEIAKKLKLEEAGEFALR